jgi:pyroglutamyl-peptidase
MRRVLVTAFEPFAGWQTNSSWLTLVELTKDLPQTPQVTTRLYPVDFGQLKERLPQDLARGYDIVLHMGQATGSSCIQLETVALNLASSSEPTVEQCTALVADGPLAYRTALPATEFSATLRQSGIPAQVSYHAGTYLCNAALYLSHHYAASNQLPVESLLLHLPLDTTQVADSPNDLASLPASTSAQAVRLILQQFADPAERS